MVAKILKELQNTFLKSDIPHFHLRKRLKNPHISPLFFAPKIETQLLLLNPVFFHISIRHCSHLPITRRVNWLFTNIKAQFSPQAPLREKQLAINNCLASSKMIPQSVKILLGMSLIVSCLIGSLKYPSGVGASLPLSRNQRFHRQSITHPGYPESSIPADDTFVPQVSFYFFHSTVNFNPVFDRELNKFQRLSTQHNNLKLNYWFETIKYVIWNNRVFRFQDISPQDIEAQSYLTPKTFHPIVESIWSCQLGSLINKIFFILSTACYIHHWIYWINISF